MAVHFKNVKLLFCVGDSHIWVQEPWNRLQNHCKYSYYEMIYLVLLENFFLIFSNFVPTTFDLYYIVWQYLNESVRVR